MVFPIQQGFHCHNTPMVRGTVWSRPTHLRSPYFGVKVISPKVKVWPVCVSEIWHILKFPFLVLYIGENGYEIALRSNSKSSYYFSFNLTLIHKLMDYFVREIPMNFPMTTWSCIYYMYAPILVEVISYLGAKECVLHSVCLLVWIACSSLKFPMILSGGCGFMYLPFLHQPSIHLPPPQSIYHHLPISLLPWITYCFSSLEQVWGDLRLPSWNVFLIRGRSYNIFHYKHPANPQNSRELKPGIHVVLQQ